MRKKILSTIQLIDGELDHYLDYCVRLGLDFDIPVQFVAAQSLATPYSLASAGVAPAASTDPVSAGVDMYAMTEEKLMTIVNDLKSVYSNVSFDLDYGLLTEKVLADEEAKDVLFWAVNLRNEDSYLNEMLGTLETTISKESNKPALNIPKNYKYKKPETLLHVVSPLNGGYDLSNIIAISEQLSLDLKFLIDGDGGKNQLRSFIENSPIDMKTFNGSIGFLPSENQKEYIQNEIELHNPDWISFQNFDTNAWSRLFTDMNTNSLLLHAQRPIIIS